MHLPHKDKKRFGARARSLPMALVFCGCMSLISPAAAQLKPTVTPLSNSGLRSDLDRFSPIHKDNFQRPCLKYEAVASPHLSNPSIFDHIVSVTNSCLQMIKVQICYDKSLDNCKVLTVFSGQHAETMLGTLPFRNFKIRTKEQF